MTVTIKNSVRSAVNTSPTVGVRVAGVLQKLLIKCNNPAFQGVQAVKDYCAQNLVWPTNEVGTGYFTIAHPEDVTPGLKVGDIDYRWYTDYQKYRLHFDSNLNPVAGYLRSTAYYYDFQMLTKAQLGAITNLEVGFLWEISNGANYLVPDPVLSGTDIIRQVQCNGSFFSDVGTSGTITFNTNAPMVWGMEFQTHRNATWRTVSRTLTAGGSMQGTAIWQGAEVSSAFLNLSIRPYWLWNTSIKGTIGTFQVLP